MEKDTRFEGLKAEILRRAKEAQACVPEYSRAYKVETLQELMEVVKENFYWCCAHGVITPELVAEHEEEFEWNGIYANKSVKSGYILASGNATVEAWGNATVRAWDNATVRASGNATVRASDNATVRAWDNATVRASGNATVRASGNATVRASGNATVRASDNATVRASDNATVRASGNATVEASGNATVEASGNAYVSSFFKIKVRLDEDAIYRLQSERIVYCNSNKISFQKHRDESDDGRAD